MVSEGVAGQGDVVPVFSNVILGFLRLEGGYAFYTMFTVVFIFSVYNDFASLGSNMFLFE